MTNAAVDAKNKSQYIPLYFFCCSISLKFWFYPFTLKRCKNRKRRLNEKMSFKKGFSRFFDAIQEELQIQNRQAQQSIWHQQ